MRVITWARVGTGRRLRALSAALVLSTSLTVPVRAVFYNVTHPEGPLTGPIEETIPVNIFYSSASLTSAAAGFTFSSDANIAVLTSSSSIVSEFDAFYVQGNVGSVSNYGDITSADGDGISVQGVTGSFYNGGTIIGQDTGGKTVDLDGGVTGTFENAGTIESAHRAIDFDADVQTFINSGTISSTGTVTTDAAGIDGRDFWTFSNSGEITSAGRTVRLVNVTNFTNSGTIESTGNGEGLYVSGNVGTFANSGTFRAIGGDGITIGGAVTTFTNATTGVIRAAGYGVSFGGDVTTFINRGDIASTDFTLSGVYFGTDVGNFTNSGTISAADGYGVRIVGDVTGSFVNEAGGTIVGVLDPGVRIQGSIASFINAGTITSTRSNSTAVEIGTSSPGTVIVNSGTLTGGQFGLRAFNGVLGRITNTATGVIQGTSFAGAGIEYQGGTIENGGTIRGYWGIGMNPVNPTQRGTVINSGTIEGTGGVAISFDYDRQGQSGDDSLTLVTGSRILGSVEFADGDDTLDVSGFQGNAILTVADLETVVTGTRLVSQQLTAGSGTVSVVDATGITGGGSTVMSEVAGAIGGEIAGALGGLAGGPGPIEPMGYAPSRPVGAAEAAADELVATAEPTGPEIWGKVFGGVAGKANDYAAVLGGIVAGSHVAVDANTRLGGVVSIAGSRFVTAGNGQTINSTIGSAGLYGSTDLGGVTLSYSVLAGVAANHSDRTVTAMVTETARADFASWYWSPELGVSIPVAMLDGVETAAGFKLRYVGGAVGSYTETGSSQNLSVGTAAVNLLDARLELTGKTLVAANDYGDVTLSGTAGLLAQHNFGSAVSIAGFPIATTQASFAYGAYGDITLEAPIGATSTASASAGVELRSDGASSASANLGLSATF